MPEPVPLQEQRVYRGDDVAAALHRTMQSVKDRISRGASLRGWGPRTPGNTLRLWLVDADHADANDPEIAKAEIPSGHWPLPPLGPVATSPGRTDVATDREPAELALGGTPTEGGTESLTQQLEVAVRQAQVEHNRRLVSERDSALALLRSKDGELKAKDAELEMVREQLRAARDGLVLHLEAYAAALKGAGPPA
jgi:hypothetical protein